MEPHIEVGPLTIELDERRALFRFADPVSTSLEIPPSFEEQLRDVAEDLSGRLRGKSVEMDLGNVPAISSRQLGLILTVREVMKPFSPLKLLSVSPSVRHLLKLTGTDRFFEP